MFGGHLQRTRQLWSVTSTVQRTNERVSDITGPQPTLIDEFYSVGYFAIRVTGKNNLALNAVNIYGAEDANGFPPAGTPTQALVSTITDIALNQGIVRAPAMHAADGDVPGRPILLPRRLLLEFSTGVPGGAPTITFLVFACFVGPHPSSVGG